MEFNPLNGNLLVRQYKKEDKNKTASGIIIPDAAQDGKNDRNLRGLVIKAEKDSEVPVGADVFFEDLMAHGIKIDEDGVPYIIINISDVDGWTSENKSE